MIFDYVETTWENIMWRNRKSRSNNAWVRLLKQVETSEFEYREYGVKRVRYKSYYGTTLDGTYWDNPYRSYAPRTWKAYRKKQFK